MVRKSRKPQRNQRETNRPKSIGSDYVRVLIVCEDEKTEPAYFKEIVDSYEISRANIKIIGTGKDPKSVVKCAKKEALAAKRIDDAYAYIFCVFDRDSHTTFDSASDTIQNNNNLTAARSWPCFEYWLLLHFECTRSSYSKKGKKSVCDDCTDDLKIHIDDYKKNYKNFAMLMDKKEDAITNSKKTRKAAKDDNSKAPITEVYKILECLKELKKTNRVRSA